MKKVIRTESHRESDKRYNAKREKARWEAVFNMKNEQDSAFHEKIKKEFDKSGLSKSEFVKKALRTLID